MPVRRARSEIWRRTAEAPSWGREISVFSLWHSGRLTAYAAYESPLRVGTGSGILFQPIEHQDTFERVSLFGRHLGLTGMLCFDLIVDTHDQAWVLECTPRATSGAHLLQQHLATAFDEPDTPQIGSGCHAVKAAIALLHPAKLLTAEVRAARDVVFRWDDCWPALLQSLGILEICWIRWRRGGSWLEAATGDIEWDGP